MTRGTGRTTKQLVEAMPNATFIWLNRHLSYPKDLAKALGREDIEIVSLGG